MMSIVASSPIRVAAAFAISTPLILSVGTAVTEDHVVLDPSRAASDRAVNIVAKAKAAGRASQAYFWTPAWQEGEREADEDIRAGRVSTFDSADDVVDWLFGPQA